MAFLFKAKESFFYLLLHLAILSPYLSLLVLPSPSFQQLAIRQREDALTLPCYQALGASVPTLRGS